MTKIYMTNTRSQVKFMFARSWKEVKKSPKLYLTNADELNSINEWLHINKHHKGTWKRLTLTQFIHVWNLATKSWTSPRGIEPEFELFTKDNDGY
jgi:hypothetical protein